MMRSVAAVCLDPLRDAARKEEEAASGINGGPLSEQQPRAKARRTHVPAGLQFSASYQRPRLLCRPIPKQIAPADRLRQPFVGIIFELTSPLVRKISLEPNPANWS